MNYSYAKDMRIDTHICTVDGKEWTFGDCIKLVAENQRLKEENQSLENQLIELGEQG